MGQVFLAGGELRFWFSWLFVVVSFVGVGVPWMLLLAVSSVADGGLGACLSLLLLHGFKACFPVCFLTLSPARGSGRVPRLIGFFLCQVGGRQAIVCDFPGQSQGLVDRRFSPLYSYRLSWRQKSSTWGGCSV
ncbi:hypothetical protein Salat_2635800 [Sesamum alatum]|uniref:Uncharacterized protein n=1 Tax=Sesamum alatum TaxID=300844 RepID=A0AAE1XNP6_9LAMI|nr:hypothetical protein Salat_2635800 [Sesamum alatum]